MSSSSDQCAKLLRTLTLGQFERQDWNPWIRECRDIYSPGHRDAFIGNGLIGLRVPPEGEPSVYPAFHEVKMAPGGTQMYGLWDTEGTVPAFNFLGLKLMHGRMVFRRDSGCITDYCQTLDWRTATVRTQCNWHHWGGCVHVDTRIWLSRSLQHLGCVEMTLTCDYDTGFGVYDTVDGDFIQGHSPMQYKLNESYVVPKAVASDFGGRKVAVATALSVDGVPVPGDVTVKPGGYEREATVMLRKGVPCTIIKCAAMMDDSEVADPLTAASMLAMSALNAHDAIRKDHEAAWEQLWQTRIEVGHPGAQALINDALYQLYCNLDEHGRGGVPGPTGLSGIAWVGHIFYDADTWTFPPAALLNCGMASNYVNYRVATLPGARRNALASGLKGALYPWEGGKSGDELLPGKVYSKQYHINSSVVQAIWTYYLASGDEEFMKDHGAEVICDCADFWVSRVTFNQEKDRYEIHQVCCPDETAGLRDNNAYTNYGAKVMMLLARKLAGKYGRPVNPAWGAIAEKMWVPFDEANQRFIEYEGYNGEMVKQADAILLIHPLDMPMSVEARRNTCQYYRDKYPAQKIMMSSSIHGIIDAMNGDTESSWRMFLDLLVHFRGDYLMVSESPFNETMSLLTGLGGMLQLVLMGWGGLKLTEEGLKATPHIPRELRFLKVMGLHGMGRRYTLEATAENFILTEDKM